MFLTMLLVTFLVAALTSGVVVYIFNKPISNILGRIVPEEISLGWLKYVKFAIYVVGISGGVRIRALEQYINPVEFDSAPLVPTTERWVLELLPDPYRGFTKYLLDATGLLCIHADCLRDCAWPGTEEQLKWVRE